MPCICYQSKKFRSNSLNLIEQVNSIIEEYTRAGYSLTLRQLYYQLVARGIIENSMKSYKNVGSLINDARLAGLIDWNSIEDRTRNLKSLPRWDSPASIIASAANQFRRDLWKDQKYHVEVWVEKEALANVIEKAVNPLDVSYFCCRGYVSQSEMWSAAQRLISKAERGKNVIVIHLGDHDPSGIDMTRDITERLEMFGNRSGLFNSKFLGVKRIALNMNQIEELNPPPNPAKVTDSRYDSYVRDYGEESWELDALDPKYITKLVRNTITEYADEPLMDKILEQVEEEQEVMQRVSDNWDEIYSDYSR